VTRIDLIDDFLLVIHSNYGCISYRFRDKRRFREKKRKFFLPSVLINSVLPSEFLSKTRMSTIPEHLTDEETDRRTKMVYAYRVISVLTRDKSDKVAIALFCCRVLTKRLLRAGRIWLI